MKLVMFVGEISPAGQQLRAAMEKSGFSCIHTNILDEIDQLGRQIGRAILIFTDSRYAFRYLSENRFIDFPCLNILFLHKQPIISEDAKSKISKVNLNIYTPATAAALAERVTKFLENPASESTDVEIEFTASSDEGSKE